MFWSHLDHSRIHKSQPVRAKRRISYGACTANNCTVIHLLASAHRKDFLIVGSVIAPMLLFESFYYMLCSRIINLQLHGSILYGDLLLVNQLN